MLRSIRSAARFTFFLPLAVLAVSCSDSSDSGGDVNGTSGGPGTPAADTTPPTVVSSSPGAGAMREAPNAELSITFSETMAPRTFTSASFVVKQGDVVVPGVVTALGDTATFVPAADLALGATYTATVTNDVTDVAGNALAASHSWSFTIDTTLPLGPPRVPLGAAGQYAVLAKAEITNVPTSVITGNVAISPAAASYVTGFSLTRAGAKWTSPQVIGGVFAADNDAPTPSNLTTAISNMEAAYTDAAGRPTPTQLDLGGGTIGGLTFTPGLYRWASGVTIPTDITISGGPNDVWIFQITGDLKMSSAKNMTLAGGARAKNIVWQVAGFVEMGTTSHSEGIMLSKTAIKLGTGATINGRLYAQTAVNLASSTVTAPAP